MVLQGKKKIVLLGCCMVLAFSGCGKVDTKTQEAMKLAESLEYTAALEVFDQAEAAGENERLIARGRGIAYMLSLIHI